MQTLSRDLFEVVVVANGPDDGTLALVRDFSSAHPSLTVRLIRIPLPSFPNALNAGFGSARRTYSTLLDDDDWISPPYLEALYQHAAPGRVTVAPFADIDPKRSLLAPSFANYLNELLYSTVGADYSFSDNPSAAAAANSGKLVETHLARSVHYALDLTSGMDVLYWASLFARHDLSIFVLPPDSGAVCFRTLSPSSMSRDYSDAFVADRFKVIGCLADLSDAAPHHAKPLQKLAIGQSRNLGRALYRNRPRYDAITERIAADPPALLDLRAVNSTAAELLACAYVFAPFVDASAVTTVKRLRATGEPFNVITFDMKTIRAADRAMDRLILPTLGSRHVVRGSPTYMSAKGSFSFAELGLRYVTPRMKGREPYRRLYSRSMWPASHILAAAIKARYPETEWTAEFSDPVSINAEGHRYDMSIRTSHPILEEVDGFLDASDLMAYGGEDYPGWVEHTVMALADQVVFTNENQRDLMIGYQPSQAVAERARHHAVVSPHPTLDRDAYSMADPKYPMSESCVNIGYFGRFYPTRGVGVILDAVKTLSISERRALTLHLFVDEPREVEPTVSSYDLGDTVRVSKYRPFLDFLALSERMDWLIVADAEVTAIFGTNPYLPSKYSDYLGSQARVWGLVEPGSPLDSRPLDHKTTLGDIDAASAFLRGLV